MGFADIKGQARVTGLLAQALKHGRVGHAYLFLGLSGVGKHLTALTLAQALNCGQSSGDACGRCPSCLRIAHGNHPDVIEIAPEKENILIEQVRGLEDKLSLGAYFGQWRAVIIDPAERMTGGAANALLKTLEEPPEKTVLLLISSAPYLLPSTIRSRCQTLYFAPLTGKDLEAVLRQGGENNPAGEDSLLRLSGGSPDAARVFLDEEIIALRDEVLKAIHPLKPSAGEEIFLLADRLAREDERLPSVLAALAGWMRDVLVAAHHLPPEELIYGSRRSELKTWAARLGPKHAAEIFSLIQDCQNDLRRNLNRQLLLENLLWKSIVPASLPRK